MFRKPETVVSRGYCSRDLFHGLIGACLLLTTPLHAAVVQDAMPETGLKRWMLTDGPLKVEIIQRLPDQTRAFFSGRNFTAEQADVIAVSGCVFQTIGTNTHPADGTEVKEETGFDMDLADWRMKHAGNTRPIKLKTDWEKAWSADVSQAARVAFQWATFPTAQTYYAGDYNWGMTTYDLKPGEHFDLNVVWKVGGETRSAWIEGIECAPDTDRLSQ